MVDRRLLAALAAVAIAVQTVAVVPGLVAAQDADVSISSVTATPSDPAPGEPFTITTNVSNLATSNETVEVTDVYVRGQGDGVNEYGRVEDMGELSPGSELSVPLSATIGSTGTKKLRVTARVRLADGSHRDVQHPLTVTVEEPNEVLVSVPTSGAPVGERTPVNVTVANGDDDAISGVELSLESDATVENDRRVAASIDAGAERHFEYDVTFDEPGTHALDATVTYTTADGATRTVTQERSVEVGSGSGGGSVQGEVRLIGVEASGSGVVTLQGDAANVGGTNAESVLLTVEDAAGVSPMGSNGQHFVGAINASQFDTFELIAEVDEDVQAVPVRVEYLVDGTRHSEVVEVNVTGDASGPSDPFGPDRDRGIERTPPVDRQPGSAGPLGIGLPLVPILVVVGIPVAGYLVWKRR